MKKLILSIILLLFTAQLSFAQTEPTDTDGNGYRNVSTLDHLRWISENSSSWDENFELENDINAGATENWNNGEGFSPIGINYSSQFTGIFDGKGYKIDSLFINRSTQSYVGLFGYANGAVIKNIGVTNCTIHGDDYVGGLVGYSISSSSISNCYSKGSVSGGGDYIGGLVGRNYSSTIRSSYSIGSVSGNSSIGGLVGVNYSEISNSYSTSNVSCTGFYVGGFVGVNYSTISNSYSIGSVSGGGFYVGGFVGYNDYSTVTNCFWDTETSGMTSSSAGTGKSTAEMKTESTFTDVSWNFDAIWQIDASINDGYPYIDDRTIEVTTGIMPTDTDGDGYRNISLLAHLVWVSENTNSWAWNFELNNDIDATPTSYWNTLKGFSPIGTNAIKFTGKFDGNGFKIDNLFINRISQSYVGFFGYANGAEITNLGLTNCTINGNDFIGGLVGVNYSTISNSYSTGNVRGIYSNVGGLVGVNYSTISNSYSSCKVVTSSYAGGLVGRNYSLVSNSYGAGNVSAVSNVGGLVGRNESSATVNNSYSIGNVSGSSSVGGLIGYNSSTVSNSFWDTQTSGLATSAGGTGKTSEEMKTKSTFANVNWDFDEIWRVNSAINNGYLYLENASTDTTGLIGPELSNPMDFSSKVNIPITFNWNGYANAINYQLQISKSENFATIFIDTYLTDTEIDIENLEYNSQYYWKVRAILANDTTFWSETWGFETDIFRNCVYEPPTDSDSDGFLNISTLCHLEWISDHSELWSSNFELDNDINAGFTRNWNGSLGFLPIGNNTTKFTGNFNGNGFRIDSLYINRPTQDYIGFFGNTSGADITNLGVTNCTIVGNNYAGGLIGFNDNSSILSNNFSSGSVSGSSSNVGGFVGSNSSSIVSNSYSRANVNGGGSNVGGLVGNNYNSSILSNCYSTGTVTGSSSVGGFVGSNSSSTVSNCFWDKQTSGKTTSSGGIGKTTAEMKAGLTFIDASWNFVGIWKINSSMNNGYPYIDDQTTEVTIGIEPTDTDGNGYRNISLFAHLVWVSENANSWAWNFELDNDINASPIFYWNSYVGFSPIGNNTTKFTGNFNGKGYKIDSLYINRPTEDYVGLFGRTNGSEISNLGVSNGNILGAGSVGGLVGLNYFSSTISNCFSTGRVIGSRHFVGGLVGQNYYSSTLSNSYSSGSVIGDSTIGGLVGHNSLSRVSNSYSTGKVSGTGDYVGGLVGYNSFNSAVNNSYSSGNVSGAGNYVGGLVGLNSSSTVNNSFWDKQTSGKTSSSGGTGKTTAEMKAKSTFTDANWNFIAIWQIGASMNNGYPYIDDKTIEVTTGIQPTDTDGNGYRNISLLAHLVWVSENENSWAWKFELDNDINAAPTYYWKTQDGFSPIGNITKKFIGKFEGHYHQIDSLFINRAEDSYVALFGYLEASDISNIKITNSIFSGNQYLGGIAGIAEYSNIINCSFYGVLSPDSTECGGISGRSDNSELNDCSVNLIIKDVKSYVGGISGNSTYDVIENSHSIISFNSLGAENFVGGLVGRLYGSYVNTSSSKGSINVPSSYAVGGLIGHSFDDVEIYNCFSTVDLTGDYKVGGFIGGTYGRGLIENSYSIGEVNGNSHTGGFVGILGAQSEVSNSFWDKETSGQNESAGGIGKQTSEMKTESTYFKWDFVNIWNINSTDNNGYPFFEISKPELSAPDLIRPIDLAIYQEKALNLNWDEVENANGYIIHVSTDSNFTTLIVNSTVGNNTESISDLSDLTQYYWRVLAFNSIDSSDWSEVWKFTTKSDFLYELDETWDFTYTSISHTIIIPASLNPKIDRRNIEIGDYIGAFFTNSSGENICAGYIEWTGQNLGLTVWGDDDQTEEKDGFAIDEDLFFKIWDGQTGKDYKSAFTIASGPEVFTSDGFTTLGNLNAITSGTQNIPLTTGWNMISSYITPREALMDSVYKALRNNILIVKNGAGKLFVPSYNINTIGDWNIHHGYQVYSTTNDTLKISGVASVPEIDSIFTSQGWNMISYLRSSKLSTPIALSSLTERNNLLIAKNARGKLFVPSYNINTIDQMEPGDGYQMYLTSLDTLIYPANGAAKVVFRDEVLENSKLQPEYISTGSDMTLIIEANYEDATEIGVYNSTDMLIGSGIFQNGKAGITIWGDDEYSENIDGARSGELLSVKVLENENLTDKKVEFADATSKMPTDELIFQKGEFLVGKISVEAIDYSIKLTPNPTTDKLTIQMSRANEISSIEIRDMKGKLMILEEIQPISSSHQMNVDALTNGTYFIIITTESGAFSEKFVKVK